MIFVYILGAALVIGALWIVSFFWGRPWSVRELMNRTFLKFVFKGPELLTYIGILEKIGIHGHNAKFSDASEAFQDKMFAFIKRDNRLLASYNTDKAKPDTKLSAAVFAWFLSDQAAGEEFRHHDYPLNQMFGAQSELPNFMMTMHPTNCRVEAYNYIKRLNKFPLKFSQIMEGLRIREQTGVIPPRFVIERVLDEMRAFTGKLPAENPLYTVFKDKLEKLPRIKQAERESLLAMVKDAIEASVYPAYTLFIDYFTSILAKATTDDGVWKLPQGDKYYAYLLRSHTTTNEDADAIHNTGLAEVARIEAAMRSIFNEQGFGAVEQPAKKLAELAKEGRFQFPDTEEGKKAGIAEYERILAEVKAQLPAWFNIQPKAELKVERIPEFREKTAPGAYYQPADLGGGRPGVFYANMRSMKEVAKFGMKTLAYHEGIPGHHFQIALAQETKKLPLFRRMLPFTAYAEGWAMYSEHLAREMGMYKDDPFGLLGSYDSELFRAVRLVVDTGIHQKRWTREQAIAYMEAHSAQDHASIVSEIERYIVMPGQACSYKMGMLTMLRLREKAKAALGDRFDIRGFHDCVLGSGAMPLGILEQVVDAYIAEQKKS